MLVDLSKEENQVLDAIRNGVKYKAGEFEKDYVRLSVEIRNVVEAAKIYILDNYKKVNDYKELHLMLRCANHDGTQYFGKRSKRKRGEKGRSEIFSKIMAELDEKTIEIKKFNEAVYDWTDGDFSVVFNGVSYNWIDSNSIIDIASHIERKLKNDNKILPEGE
jgi:hypothetical protein